MNFVSVVALALVGSLAACAHTESNTSSTPATAAAQPADGPKESKTVQQIRKRAAFDLSCAEDQIKVSELQKGTFMQAASYGAVCGDKRVSYLERMGTIIKQ